MSEDILLYELNDHVVTLTLNRDESRNVISDDEMVGAIVEACARINADPDVRCAIITGAGRAFSAGGNVKDMQNKSGMFGGTPPQLRDGYRNGIQRIPMAVYDLEVPIIAAVNGPAIGAGCDLAMMCDLRIASEKAIFAESFVKVGLIPGDGGAWFLPRVIGAAKANEMAFTGEPVDAAKALDLLNAANALARRIAVNPPVALRMTKKLLKESQQASLTALLEMSASLQALAHQEPHHEEAVAAIIEKRPPDFG